MLLDLPVYVTAHLINEKLDDGLKLFAMRVPIFPEDNIDELKSRCLRFQVYMNEPVVGSYSSGTVVPQPVGRKSYNQKLNHAQLNDVQRLFEDWKKRHLTFQ